MGQVATIIENLHLSYDEVVNKIPYKTLMIMQKDKVQAVTGDMVIKVSGRSFAERRMAAMRQKKEENTLKQ